MQRKHLSIAIALISLTLALSACQPQKEIAKTYCAEHDLPAGLPIKKSDLHEGEEDISGFIEAPATDLSQIVGRKPSRTIDSGSYVLKSDFEPEPTTGGVLCLAKENISKGQIVQPSSIEVRLYKEIPKHWMPIIAANHVVGRTAAVALEKGTKISWYQIEGAQRIEGAFSVLPPPVQNLQPSKEQLSQRSGCNKVVMATRKMKRGEVFISPALAEIFVPAERVPEDAITEISFAAGRSATTDIERGEFIKQRHLTPQGTNMRARIPRSVVAQKNIRAGEVISEKSVAENTQYADRVQNGCDIIGLKVKRTIKKGTPILWYAFE